MQVPATGSTRLRVGDFEVDLRCGELRRNGDKIKLQERPFQILAALLERPGEVVTRQEMQQKLWPTDTFVDFEHSINTAVKKLREALGDDAENPRFIETLPRRGYRLIAPVEIVDENGVSLEAAISPVPPQQGNPPGTKRQKRWPMAAIGGALVTLIVATVSLALFFPFPWRRTTRPVTQRVGADHQFRRLGNFACVVTRWAHDCLHSRAGDLRHTGPGLCKDVAGRPARAADP
jgi:DNA-binding winged helix-turn-helix (wHTH) protein